MTPFGARVRALRVARNLQLKHMAASLGVSSAYLSALERGERGRPSLAFTQRVIHYFGVIWDEADELQRLAELSEPRPKVDTRGLGPAATLAANRLAREARGLSEEDWRALLALLDAARGRGGPG
ncbi:MAG TPA: helix-turn-helix domain-containing protein [Salinarimonas sp.]|nr:helix-turn-helix domain-containing protein [Salinarimonas sp.]